MAHLGLGAFHRAHQAWYTEHANRRSDPDATWGYASLTGRSPAAAVALAAQDHEYTVITRAADGDRAEIVRAITASGDGSDRTVTRSLIAREQVVVITLTVTEAAYHLTGAGGLDLADPGVQHDIRVLRDDLREPLSTVAGRLVDGLAARRRASGAPIALVSCDNLGDNATVTSRMVRELAAETDHGLAGWIEGAVSFVSTMVDRITPAVAPADIVPPPMLNGSPDAMAVVTEPFSDWVLAGDFPGGRPAWELAGARFVADVRPYEESKLWLLNAGHSALAYLGLLRGHEYVADAAADPRCAALLERLWADAAVVIDLPQDEVARSTAAILDRFANPRIGHRLSQIGRDGTHKLRERCIPVIRRWISARGALPAGPFELVAAWVVALQRHPAVASDAAERSVVDLAQRDVGAAVVAALTLLAPDLAAREDVRLLVLSETTEIMAVS
jgi:fructuronate reductase